MYDSSKNTIKFTAVVKLCHDGGTILKNNNKLEVSGADSYRRYSFIKIRLVNPPSLPAGYKGCKCGPYKCWLKYSIHYSS